MWSNQDPRRVLSGVRIVVCRFFRELGGVERNELGLGFVYGPGRVDLFFPTYEKNLQTAEAWDSNIQWISAPERMKESSQDQEPNFSWVPQVGWVKDQEDVVEDIDGAQLAALESKSPV